MEQFYAHPEDPASEHIVHSHRYDSFDRLRDWGLFCFAIAQLVLLVVVLVFVVRERDSMETAAAALTQISQALTTLAGGGGAGQAAK